MEKKESEMNEGEILTLAQTFKDLIKIKNDEIMELRKILMLSYSLFRLLDEEIEGHDLVERGRSITSSAIEEWVMKD
jgi:hypothetical protein